MTEPEDGRPGPDLPEEAPEDIRKAVRQLSFAYRRAAEEFDDTRRDLLPEAIRRAEAVLFAAGEPLSAEQVAQSLPQGIEASEVLMALKKLYSGRGVGLMEIAGKWRFQTAEDLAFLFVEEREQQKKLSQAALETLAIIAYGQPVTRAEIEAVRGVAVSKGTIDTLMETGWVRIRGRRKTPGRPVTFGTTDAFLEHFGLESLDLLPNRAEYQADGLLSDVLPEAGGAGADPHARGEEADGAPDTDGDDREFVTDYMAASTAAE